MLSTVKDVLRPVYYDTGAAKLVQRWRRRPAAFERERAAYMRRHVTAAMDKPSDPHLAGLVENGFVLIPVLHDRALIQLLHDRIYDLAERVRTGKHDKEWKTLTYQEDGIYRIRDIEGVVPEARQILDHPLTNGLVRSYLQTAKFRTTGNYIDFKPDLVHDYTTVPHLDSWKSQLKIFTLLADVGEANAIRLHDVVGRLHRRRRRGAAARAARPPQFGRACSATRGHDYGAGGQRHHRGYARCSSREQSARRLSAADRAEIHRRMTRTNR